MNYHGPQNMSIWIIKRNPNPATRGGSGKVESI
ncbi:hypothetical protein DESC_290004 [Desulfosarcina cetonica]|nr:hypothetical protein DESC_290004 [Desulfosarcina cetonica]